MENGKITDGVLRVIGDIPENERAAAFEYVLAYMKGEPVDAERYPELVAQMVETDATSEEIRRIIGHLNSRCGTSFRANGEKTKQLIRARYRQGFREADFLAVIDSKADEWMNTDLERYLRPETLFGTRFESYLQYAKKRRNPSREASFDTDEFFGAALARSYGG